MTALLISSFLAGVLTILAPCVLPVLPVVLAGSVTEKQKWYPYLVTLSLALSIVLFTVILKATTALIDIPPAFWKYLSGSILLALGLIYIFPHAWAWIAGRLGLGRSALSLDHAQDIGSPALRAIATGAALGPVFSTCSPTYSLLLATVFPVSLLAGIGYTLVYALGLALMLTIIAIGGRSIIARFRGIADERGSFKRILGIVFVLIGLAIISGLDKRIETYLVTHYDVTSIEQGVLDRFMP
jgi:cytochrome c biogenesis protein CcdA